MSYSSDLWLVCRGAGDLQLCMPSVKDMRVNSSLGWQRKTRVLSLDRQCFYLVVLLTENASLKQGGEAVSTLTKENRFFLEKPNQQKPMSTAETSQIFWWVFVAILAQEHWELLKKKLTHWNTE